MPPQLTSFIAYENTLTMNVTKWALVEIQKLKSDLKFPEFESNLSPLITWGLGDQLISGFHRPQESAVLVRTMTNPQDHVDYFLQVHPAFSLVQLCHLLALPWAQEMIDLDLLITRLGKGQKQNIVSLVDKIIDLPPRLQAWIHEKDLRAQDLAPLRAAPPGIFNDLAEPFLLTRPSKSEGAPLLEMLVDLHLLEFPHSSLLEALKGTANEALTQLRRLRYPQSHQSDSQMKAKLDLNWPSNVQARFQRRGDRAGFDLQMFVTNPIELKKAVNNLEKVIEEWNSPSPTP